jgi:hypothetical protein
MPCRKPNRGWQRVDIRKVPKPKKEAAKAINERFLEDRRFHHQELKARLAASEIDHMGRRLLIKMMRLPFAATTYSCDGHFKKDRYSKEHIPLNELTQHKKLVYTATSFHIEQNLSQDSTRFLNELKALAKRLPFATIWGWPNNFHLQVHKTGERRREVSPQEAQRILEEKRLFIQEFERIVDRFLPKKRKTPR